MNTDSQRNEESSETAPATSDCPLSTRQQTRNLLIFGINKSVAYFAGCVMYVGNIDAVLLKELGYSDVVANLPAAAFFWTVAPFMILFTWYFCQVRLLKPMLAGAYLVLASTGAMMVAALLFPTPNLVLPILVARAIVASWCVGVVGYYEWEILARGVTEKRRGLALGLAYGFGPALAVLGSLGMQLVLYGKMWFFSIAKIHYPWNYIILFGATLPIISVAGLLATRYVVPPPRVEIAREPLLSGVFGGIGKFFSYRLLVIIVIVYMLVSMGSDAILPNVTMNTKVALGESPEHYVGYQYALRFGFKIATGFFLGWLLVKTNAKIALLASMFLCVAGLSWAMAVSGTWYLLAFGILGAGELCCVYYQNYLVSCSEKSMVRRNLAYAGLLMMPVALMPVVYGTISGNFGFASSFRVAMVLLIAAIVIAVLLLPTRPRPQEPDTDT